MSRDTHFINIHNSKFKIVKLENHKFESYLNILTRFEHESNEYNFDLSHDE